MNNSSGNAVYLVRSLLDYCGIDAAGLEEENKALLSIDYDTTVFIVIESSLIHLIAPLGGAPRSEAFYLNLLNENFSNCTRADYNYAIDPGSGELLMSRTIQGDGLEAGGLIQAFEDFVRYAEAWAASLLAGNENIPDKAEREPPALSDRQVAPADPGSAGLPFLKV